MDKKNVTAPFEMVAGSHVNAGTAEYIAFVIFF